jgi:hypothetical protein
MALKAYPTPFMLNIQLTSSKTCTPKFYSLRPFENSFSAKSLLKNHPILSRTLQRTNSPSTMKNLILSYFPVSHSAGIAQSMRQIIFLAEASLSSTLIVRNCPTKSFRNMCFEPNLEEQIFRRIKSPSVFLVLIS